MRDSQIIPLPVPLPRGFLDLLGYESGRRFVAVFWEQRANCLVVFDGVSLKPVEKADPFIALCLSDGLIELEEQHGTRLWDMNAPTTHWLLIDIEDDEAWVAPVGLAQRCVLEQIVPRSLKKSVAK